MRVHQLGVSVLVWITLLPCVGYGRRFRSRNRLDESSVSILPTPVPSLPPDCKCQTNLKHLRRKFYTAQRFDYVIDASLESTTGAGAGHVITTVYVHNVLKKSSVKVTKKQEMKLWTTGACHCQAFLQRNRYVIMGYEDKTNKQLLLDDQSAVFLWNSSHIKRIRKWNKKLNRRVNRRVNNNNRNRSKDSRRSTPSPRVRQKPHRRNNSIRKRKQERRKRRKRKRGRGRNGNRVRRHVAKTDAYG